jgi:hypothetical protein
LAAGPGEEELVADEEAAWDMVRALGTKGL